MKKDRKNIILESLASMLEERNMSKVTTALLAEKSGITEAALYRHFPSKRAIYAELFSFCDNAIFSKCNELKKEKLSSKDKIKNSFLFFMILLRRIKVLLGSYLVRLYRLMSKMFQITSINFMRGLSYFSDKF